MNRRFLVVAAAILPLAACTAAPPPAPLPRPVRTAPASWQEPARYTYVLESGCGERPLIGRFRLTVTAGKVTTAVGLDAASRSALTTTPQLTPPTLGQLLQQVDTARRAGAHVAKAVTDPADGHPTEVNLDPIANAIDDEACYTVTNYQVG
jgi:hypothetical protein